MPILPNGLIRITNQDTGETRDVTPQDLPKYGEGAVRSYMSELANQQPSTPSAQRVSQDEPVDPEAVIRSQQQEAPQSLTEKVGTGIMNFGKAIVDPFARTGQNIMGAGLENARKDELSKNERDANASADQLLALSKALRSETDPVKKQALIEQSRRMSGMAENAAQTVTNTANTANPFMDQATLEKVSQPLSFDKGSALRQQAADSLNIATYAVPFGKGGNILTKAILPGATVGAAQAISQGGNRDVSMPEIVGSAALGAAIPTAIEGLGKLKGGLSKGANVLEKTGADVEQGVRQIKLPPSVGGAQEEKAVNTVLDNLKIHGTPQQQYEKLQPVMTDIENKIHASLKTNPQTFSQQQVKQAITNQLSSEGFLIGDAARAEASQVLDDVMKDVIAKGKQGPLTSEEVFNAKQQLNSIYKRLDKKVNAGQMLGPQEEVLYASRDALDRAIGDLHPEVKDMTMQQSRLFEAAKSLSSARVNAPTLRAMSTSLPGGITTRAQLAAGGALKNAGKVAEGASNILPSGVNTITGQIGSKSPGVIQDFQNQSPQVEQSLQDEQTNPELDNKQNDIHDASIPPMGKYTVEEAAQAMQAAALDGNTKAVNEWKTVYDSEVQHRKEVQAARGSSKPMSSVSAKDYARNTTALKDLTSMEKELYNPDGTVDTTKIGLADIPGSLGARKYRALWGSIVDTIGTNRTGASYTKDQRADYASMLPQYGDSNKVIKDKLARLKQEIELYKNAAKGSSDVSAIMPDMGTQ